MNIINIKSWVKVLESKPVQNRLPFRKILIFSFLEGWLEVALQTAFVLAHRNCEVVFAYLPQYNHIFLKDLSNEEILLFKNIYGNQFDQLRCKAINFVNINDLARIKLPDDFDNMLIKQSSVDTAYCLKKSNVDIDGADNGAFQIRMARNKYCAERIFGLCEKEKFDLATLPHGGVLEFGIVVKVAEYLSLPYTCWEYAERKGNLLIEQNNPAISFKTDYIWKLDEPHILDKNREQRVGRIISSRENAEFESFKFRYQTQQKNSIVKIREKLKLKENIPVILICPNIGWDALLFHNPENIFKDIPTWLSETFNYLANKENCYVIIREHPAATRFGDAESPSSILDKAFIELPKNFRLIPSADPINTYSLMDITDLGIVFISTTGLEMAQRGIKVIVAGPAHYSRKSFTIDPNSKREYWEILDKFLNNKDFIQLNSRQKELAWCYTDVYFNDHPKETPCNLRSWRQDVEVWNIERLLSEEGQKKFGNTYDFLAGRNIQWGAYSDNNDNLFNDVIITEKVKLRLDMKDKLAQLIVNENFEYDIRLFVMKFLKEGDVFFDIGSNFGLFSLIASKKLNGTGEVHSFEPCGRIYMQLRRNIRLNQFGNIYANRIALSNNSGNVKLQLAKDGFDAWNSIAPPAGLGAVSKEKAKYEIVDAETLDNYVKHNEIMKIDLLKLDVEGWEEQVLEGGKELFQKDTAPILLVEFCDETSRSAGTSSENLYKKILNLGYKLYRYNSKNNQLIPEPFRGLYPYDNLVCTKDFEFVINRLESD